MSLQVRNAVLLRLEEPSRELADPTKEISQGF
jgi:hypothetical protein